MTNVCNTVILMLLMVKTMSNQWPSSCSVNNWDKMGQPGGGSTAEKTSNRGMYHLQCEWGISFLFSVNSPDVLPCPQFILCGISRHRSH